MIQPWQHPILLFFSFVHDGPECSIKGEAAQTALKSRIDCVKVAQEYLSSMHGSEYLQNEAAPLSQRYIFEKVARGIENLYDWLLLLDSEYGSSYSGSLFLGIDEVEQTCSSQDNLLSMTEILISKIQPTWIPVHPSGDHHDSDSTRIDYVRLYASTLRRIQTI